MHITRSMPLQQQNHEKLQVFHGDTKLKCAEQSTGCLSTYQTRREQRGTLSHRFLTFPPCISEIKCTMSLLSHGDCEKHKQLHIFVHVARAHVPLLKWTKNSSSSSTPNFDPTHRPTARVVYKINHDTYMPKNSSRCSLKYGFRCDLLCN